MDNCGVSLKGAISIMGEVLIPGATSPRIRRVLLLDGKVYVAGHCLGERAALERDGRFRPADVGEVGHTTAALVAVGSGLRTARADRSALWSGARVPYVIDSEFSETMQNRIASAIAYYTMNTPIRWVPTDEDSSFIRFVLWKDPDASGGNSDVGRTGQREQLLKLTNNTSRSTIIHEMGHVIGLKHEQSRPDRDDWVEVFDQNIIDGKEGNFEKFSADEVTAFGAYNHRSVMHYRSTTFGIDTPTGQATTISAVAPPGILDADLGSNNDFDNSELDWIKKLYPLTLVHTGGAGWGDDRGVTSMTFGRFTRTGRPDQLLIARNGGDNMRLQVYDDIRDSFESLIELGTSWGDSRYARAVVAADFDGDGIDEIVIGRNEGDNFRLGIRKVNAARDGYEVKAEISEWRGGAGVSCLAYGLDQDGAHLLAVGRKSTGGARYLLYRVIVTGGTFELREIWTGGDNWSSGVSTVSVALADVDGDGWLELIVASNGPDRLIVLDDRNAGIPHRMMGNPGDRIPSGLEVTCVIAADLDGGGSAELVVGTNGTEDKLFVLNDARNDFELKSRFGASLRDDAAVTCLAIGDLDWDGRPELVVGLSARNGPRAVILGFDDTRGAEWPLFVEDDIGRGWGASRSASAVAIYAGPSQALLAVGRNAGGNSRFSITRWNR